MKKIILLCFSFLSLFHFCFSQQASRTLDFIQTKDGRKYYGKILTIDPKEGISIQTYGEGTAVKLTHSEIETVKLGNNVVNEEKRDSSRWVFKTGVSLYYSSPFIDKNPSNMILFNDTNNYGFSRMGIHVEPTFIARGKHCFGMVIGYERGRHFSSVPVAFTMKFGKKINSKNVAYVNLMGGFQVYTSKVTDYLDAAGTYVPKSRYRNTSTVAGIGLGVLHYLPANNKLFADISCRFDNYTVGYYTGDASIRYVREMAVLCNALQLRAGIMF